MLDVLRISSREVVSFIGTVTLISVSCGSGTCCSRSLDAMPDGGDGAAADADQASIAREQAIAACITVGSCLVPPRLNECFHTVLPHLTRDEIACLATALPGCDTLKCTGSAWVDQPCSKADEGKTGCEGDVLWKCFFGFWQRTDCARSIDSTSDSKCVLAPPFGAKCSVGPCTTDASFCDGTRAMTCSNGLLSAQECARKATTCSGGACQVRLDTCPSDQPERCEGEVLVYCAVGGRAEARIDCSQLPSGQRCVSATDSRGVPRAFCGFGTECFPEKDAETCSGATRSFCAGGIRRTMDCKAAGFLACKLGACTHEL